MPFKIFVNLPVADLEKSKTFFKSLGFNFNAQFTDETAASMVISDDIYAMLLTHEKYKMFTDKTIVDARQSSEVLTALSVDSKEKVDEILNKALAAGGTQTRPAQDHGFMYGRSFDDPDGHTWEIFWMDPSSVKPA